MDEKLYKGDHTKGEIELINEDHSKDIVYENKFCKLYNDEVVFPSGAYGRFLRLAMTGRGSVAILPITENGEKVFVKTFRNSARGWGIEVPKGYCAENEEPIKSAERELREETGLVSVKIEYLGLYHESPSTIQYGLHCFIAWDCKKVSNLNLEETEAISENIVVKSSKELPKLDYKDAITDMLIAQYSLKQLEQSMEDSCM